MSKSILIVEDNQTAINHIHTAFEGSGLEVTVVEDLESALKALQKKDFDYHVVDLFFPQEKGSGKKDWAKKLMAYAVWGLARNITSNKESCEIREDREGVKFFWNFVGSILFSITRLPLFENLPKEIYDRFIEKISSKIEEGERLAESNEFRIKVVGWYKAALRWVQDASEEEIPNGFLLWKYLKESGKKAFIFSDTFHHAASAEGLYSLMQGTGYEDASNKNELATWQELASWFTKER